MEQTDWHQQTEDRFIQQVADELLADLRRRQFSSLILAAAPTALGVLRRAMSDEVKATIVAEVDKDLTRMPLTSWRTPSSRRSKLPEERGPLIALSVPIRAGMPD